jgi:hypothetical protein
LEDFMDAAVAQESAVAMLREIEDPASPLVLSPDSDPRDFPWCWVFAFNSARYFETRQFSDAVVSGPIVVVKDSSDVWVAPSAPPVEQWLNQYAQEHGLTPVPLPPPPPNPFV